MPTKLQQVGWGSARVEGVPNEDYVEAVLSVVERIPAGRVMAYGDIAEYVGSGGPRQVGWVMSHYGGGVPWWRVVRADGRPANCHVGESVRLLRSEGTPFRGPRSDRVDMAGARWDGSPSP
jgi:alkylated DNA nucleotide flippase Atl1